MARQIDFWTLLRMTQEYVSSHYAAVLTIKQSSLSSRLTWISTCEITTSRWKA